MRLEENHQEAKPDENHDMDVLKHRVLVVHVFRGSKVLSVKVSPSGSGVDGTFLHLSCEAIDDQ